MDSAGEWWVMHPTRELREWRRIEMSFHPGVRRARAELRRALSLRPTTRLDVVIFLNGEAYVTVPTGILVRVR